MSGSNAVPIAVLASGRGSNFDAIQAAIDHGQLNARIVAVLSDRRDAPVLVKARSKGLQSLVVPGEKDREAHDQKVIDALAPFAPRFLVMAGYMRVVTSRLIEAYRSERGYSRILNVHPSLLPAFPGVSAYEQAYQHGCAVAGVTVHLVELEVDSGPICAQESFQIGDCTSVEEVEKRGLAVEHRLFPATLNWVLSERFEIEKRKGRLCVRSS